GSIWSLLEPAVTRFFRVDIVLRERPRPDFDEGRYLEKIGHGLPLWIAPRWEISQPPRNILLSSKANPLARESVPFPKKKSPEMEPNPPDLLEAFQTTPRGGCSLLIGPGGAGKSTCL